MHILLKLVVFNRVQKHYNQGQNRATVQATTMWFSAWKYISVDILNTPEGKITFS